MDILFLVIRRLSRIGRLSNMSGNSVKLPLLIEIPHSFVHLASAAGIFKIFVFSRLRVLSLLRFPISS